MSVPPALSRRTLLRLGLGAAATPLAPRGAVASRAPRALAFRNLHTGEFLRAAYWADGRFVPEALRAIDRVLRDHRTDEVREMDRRLLNLLSELRGRLDTAEPFEVISGYRSPATNALLARTTTGVAAGSLHVLGMAVDVRIPGRRLGALRDAALGLRRGGVGYYPDSGFVHVDVGRIRAW